MLSEIDDDDETAEAGPTKGKQGNSEDDEALLQRIGKWERLARNHWSDWQEEARLCYDFVAGHQWSSEDKATLLDQMRQPVTFNRVAPMVDGVIGAEILNRQQVRYSPREQGDVKVDEIITAAAEWVRDQADTEDEESDAFADVVICGMGWTETRMDYTDDPEGRIVVDRIDPLEMWSDPFAKKRNLVDSRYRIRAKWWTRDQLPKEWKAKIPSAGQQEGSGNIDEMQTGWTGSGDNYERADEPPDKTRDANKERIWIRQVQWWELEDAYRVADPMQGKLVTLTKEQYRKVALMYLRQPPVDMGDGTLSKPRPPKAVKIQKKVFHQAFISGQTILERDEIEAEAFTINCITGKRDRNSNTFYGTVRAMMDPQRWGNKFFVQILHVLNTAAKGGLLYETSAFANPRKAIEDWSKPDAAIEMKDGALAAERARERAPAVFPAGTEKMLEFALQSLPQTSGISLEMLGLAQTDQANSLEVTRKKSGYAILAVFFDALRRYRKIQGRVQLYFIQNYISDGRLVRIKGQDSTIQYLPLVHQPDLATYDIIVDDAPMSPNQKEQVWGMMMQMMPMLTKLQVPPQVWSLMLEYSPLPSTVSEKITQAIQQQAQQPPQPDPRVQAAQIQAQGNMAKTQADLQRIQQQGQTDAQQAQADASHQERKFQMDMATKSVDLQIKKEDLNIAREKAAVDLERDRQKATIDIIAARAAAQTPPKTSVSA